MYSMISLLLLSFYGFKSTLAWWDITHMTIASIAETLMKEADIKKLNTYLEVWEFNYPKMSTIVNSTTFPDHVRCTDTNTLNCKGLPFADVAVMFNGMHTSQIPYTGGFDFDLTDVRRPVTMEGSSEGIVFLMESIKDHVDAMKKVRECTGENCPVQKGSDYSWNWLLRFYLHMFGDIHMPCHCGSGVSELFPLGDAFCGGIKMESPKASDFGITEDGKDSFHQYMDGIGYTAYGRWPNYEPEEIKKFANEYIEEFPRDSYGTELIDDFDHWDFKAIAYESFAEMNQFYDDIDFFSFKTMDDAKLNLNETTQADFQQRLKKRVALAGYRMAKGLTDYANALPDVDSSIYSLLSNEHPQMLINRNTYAEMENQIAEFEKQVAALEDQVNTGSVGSSSGSQDTIVIVLAVATAVFVVATGVASYSLYNTQKANKAMGA